MKSPDNQPSREAKQELENCPFCGCSATLKPSKSKVGGFIVICDEHDCQTIKSGSTKTAAIRNWNCRPCTRTPPISYAAAVEKVARAIYESSWVGPWNFENESDVNRMRLSLAAKAALDAMGIKSTEER